MSEHVERLRMCLMVVAACSMGATYDLPTGNQFYVANKVYTDPAVHAWSTSSPAAQAIDATKLATAANTIGKYRAARALLVARNGQLVFERYFNGGTAQQARNIHSASKSILSATVGAAIADGKLSLDTTLQAALGGKYAVPANKQAISVRHLLAMTSGIQWSEDSTEYRIGADRVRSILGLKQAYKPGTRWNYSTGDATLLAAVVAEKAGGYAGYAIDRILAPAGITVERWGIDPQGYYSGGCNFFITPREMLRFGQTYLDATSVDREWITLSTTPTAEADYGLMWWTDVGVGNFRAWGWGQQFIYVWPAKQLVCVTVYDTAGSVNDGDNYSTIRNYVYAAAK